MDIMIQEKVLQKQNELNASYDEKLRNYQERYVLNMSLRLLSQQCYFTREQDLQRQVTLARNQLRDLRMSNDSNQAKLLDHSQRQGIVCFALFSGRYSCLNAVDQEVAAKLAELDMIAADLDHANSRVATVEHRNVSWRIC